MKAAIFDMDGLMFDTEIIAFSAWKEVSKEMNFSLSDKQIEFFRGSNKEFKREYFKKWYGDNVDYDEVYTRRQIIMDEYYKNNPVPIKKGLFELLDALKEKGYKIAIATSTLRDKAEKFWMSTGVDKYIHTSVCGNEVKNSKPNPEIFLLAAKKLNVSINACYVLEDSENGLKAGHLAGAKTIMIPDLTTPTDNIKKYCDYIFEDLSKVINIL